MGSEPGIGWNRTCRPQGYPTWVLCDETFNKAGIRRYLERHGPIENLQFVFVPPNRCEKLLRRVPGLYYLTRTCGIAGRTRLHAGFMKICHSICCTK